jgi:galactofuranose transport system permease protein
MTKRFFPGKSNSALPGVKKIIHSTIFWPMVFLSVIMLINLIINPGFFNISVVNGRLSGSLIDIMNRSSYIILLAIGMTFVIATAGIDISVGAVVAISAAFSAYLIGGTLVLKDGVQHYVSSVPMPVAVIAALMLATLLGMWNGLLISRVGMQPIIATLILMVAGRGIAQLITSGQIITIYYKPFDFIGTGYILGIPFSIYIVAAILAVVIFLIKRTALGIFIQAVGINKTATRFAGINSANIILWVYAFSGFCAGIVGLLVCSNNRSADGNNAGLNMELDAILAVVLGGTSLAGGKFYILGSVVGGVIIQSLTTTIYSLKFIPPEANLVVKAVIVFIACLIQSESFRKMVAGIIFRKENVA